MKSLNLMFFALAIFSSCFFLQDRKKKCQLAGVETIFTDVSTHGGKNAKYIHHVLVEGYSKKCLIDSAELLMTTKRYLDTVSLMAKPVAIIYFYSSKDKFIASETSQDWDYVNKDCLFKMQLNIFKNEVIRIQSYDENGKLENDKKRE